MLDNPQEPSEEVIESVEDSTGAPETGHEAIETEGETQTDAAESEQEELPVYYDIDGEEVSLEDVRKWKSGHMMQSDYTKKTQVAAEETKAAKAERAELTEGFETLSAIESEIEALILGEQSVDMDELRQVDTAEYLRVKELQEAKKSQLSSLKQKHVEKLNALSAQNAERLHKALDWVDESGQVTDKREADIKALMDYKQEVGIDDIEFKSINSPAVMQAVLEASKYRKLMAEKSSIVKRVVKTPKAVKPKSTPTTQKLSLAERLYGTN